MNLKKKSIASLILAASMVFLPFTGFVRAEDTNDDGARNFVARCYDIALGREAEEDGFDFWLDQLKEGKITGTGAALSFITSPEYRSKNTSDEAYINDLYTLFMGREADKEGYEFWKKNISQLGRDGVFDGFANSEEFYNLCNENGITAGFYSAAYDFDKLQKVNMFVDRFYAYCFNRKGDMGGQKHWVENLLAGNLTGTDCAAFFIFSDEFLSLGLSDADYVESLYKLFMDRASEAEGKAYWIGLLENGSTREEVFAGFASAPEFQTICDTYGIPKGTYTIIGIEDPKKPEVTPTATPAPTATLEPTATVAPTATAKPTVKPTATAKPTATTVPTATPTPLPDKYLELDGKKSTWVKTTEVSYFITDYAYVFVDKDIDVRGDTAKVIDDIFRANEKNTGLSYSNNFLSEATGYELRDLDGFDYYDQVYFGEAFKDLERDYTKISIIVTDQDNIEPHAAWREVLVNACDIDFSDDLDYLPDCIALPHELLHVLHSNNGYKFSTTLNEGFTTAFSYDCISAVENYDVPESHYRNNYNYINYEINEDNAETLFLNDFEDGWDAYLYGYRFVTYLKMTYGNDAFAKLLKVANTYEYDREYTDQLTNASSAKALKKAFGDNVFKEFGKWYTENPELFAEMS